MNIHRSYPVYSQQVNIFGDQGDGSAGPSGPRGFQDLPDPEALNEVKAILERMVLKRYIDGFQTW